MCPPSYSGSASLTLHNELLANEAAGDAIDKNIQPEQIRLTPLSKLLRPVTNERLSKMCNINEII